MILEEVMRWLVEEGYVRFHKGKPVFTEKYHGNSVTSLSTTKTTETAIAVLSKDDYEGLYKKFLLQCDIPMRGYDNLGRAYALNKFSKDGAKAFELALKKGYNPEIIRLAVFTYYKSSIQYKMAVTNYMCSGSWETDYDVLLKKHEEGKLTEHLKQETHVHTSRFTRG